MKKIKKSLLVLLAFASTTAISENKFIVIIDNHNGGYVEGSIDKDEPTGRNMCIDILNRGDSVGDGVYTVDYNLSDSVIEKLSYCDMSGGGWTLYDTFGTKLVKTGTDNPKAYNADNINDLAGITNAGYTTTFNGINAGYTPSPYYVQAYQGGSPLGNLRKIMPEWIQDVKVAASNEWYTGNNTVVYGSDSRALISSQPYTEFIFSTGGGKEILMEENGIIWIDSVWVK